MSFAPNLSFAFVPFTSLCLLFGAVACAASRVAFGAFDEGTAAGGDACEKGCKCGTESSFAPSLFFVFVPFTSLCLSFDTSACADSAAGARDGAGVGELRRSLSGTYTVLPFDTSSFPILAV